MTWRWHLAAGSISVLAGLMVWAAPAEAGFHCDHQYGCWRAWEPGAASLPSQAGSGGDPRGGVVESDRETRVLTLGPTGTLELKTFAGDITVVSGSGRDVQIEILRQSTGRTADEARAGLDQIKVLTEHVGDRAALSVVSSTRRPTGRVRVNYSVSVPAGTRVVAGVVMGNVSVKGLKGELDVQTTSGNVTIANSAQVSSARVLTGTLTLTDVASPEGLTVGAVNATVRLEKIKARQLDVDVTAGDIQVRDSAIEQLQIRSLSGSIDYAGPITRGGRYQIQTHSGEVRLQIAGGAGFELQASSFAGGIKADPSFTSKAVGMTPQSLHTIVGDGSARVIAITFSGNVIISKR